MKFCVIGVLVLQLLTQCSSRGVPESVVSVYHGPGGTGDVYHQIANNIAERITSPIYRFLGFGKNKTESAAKKPWDKIESLDESMEVNKPDLKPLENGIDNRDVEELSVEALKKEDKKPEKITLFSSYLPLGELNSPKNDTANEIDSLEFDDDDADSDEKPRESGIVYILELIGSFFQLALGAFLALFKPSSS